MSRIGNKAITVPNGVKCDINGGYIKVTGPKGTLERQLRPEIEIVADGNTLLVKGADASKRTNAFCGMSRTLVNNMIIGTEKGFKKTLQVEGVGYKVKLAGQKLVLNVGFSNPVDFMLPDAVKATINGNDIVLESINNEQLGETAAKIREIRKPEPYKGKGIRYENEYIARKVGKAAGKK
ncbi:LSU ribosomal protein L6p (L9e) [hydrothermal vent metagenome]|uniref:LSU ribosomal protein L6p (L9e) n=1 Tax=hydrothermal vent metagenome TaxID=652676 RepID=A0A3B0VW86_9ZZZZ